MAAKVASSAQGGSERDEGPGVSYASVLNPARGGEPAVARASIAKDNNKENIGQVGQSPTGAKERLAAHAQSAVQARGKSYQKSGRRFNAHPTSKTERRGYHAGSGQYSEREAVGKDGQTSREPPLRQKEPAQHARTERCETENHNGELASDGEFQTVAPKSARRKEKLQRDYREHHAHRERHRHHERHSQQPRGHSAGGSKERAHKERSEKHSEHAPAKEACPEKEECAAEADGDQPVKYVEAPLPAVNPWMKSKGQPAQTSAAPLQKQTVQQQPQPQPQQRQQPVAVATATVAAPVTVPVPPTVGAPTVAAVPTTAASTTVHKAEKAPAQSEREKRVLQPQQQQGKIGESI